MTVIDKPIYTIDLTPQEAYEKIVAYFSRPGAVLAEVKGTCSYRTPEGNACAVGCLIPDEAYDPVLDNTEVFSNTSLDSIVEDGGLAVSNSETLEFLEEVQALHDGNSDNAKHFLARLAGIKPEA